MGVAFRNVDASPDDPVETWPFEGVLAALERGGLDEWRRLVRAIRVSPWGRVARHVEQAIDVAHPFGISEVMTEVIAEARSNTELSERQEVASMVRNLIAASGRTRAQFASDIGTSTSRLSTYTTGSVTPSATLLVRMHRIAGQGGLQINTPGD